MDLILRQARLPTGLTVDIGIDDGWIVALETALGPVAKKEIDVQGGLVVPGFVNGHLHACKSYWREGLVQIGLDPDLRQAPQRFEAIAKLKRTYNATEVMQRAERTVREGIRHGTCAFRLFADVDSDAGLRALEGLLALRQKYQHLLPIQVVAFPQNGVFREASSTEQLLRQALEMGVDGLGGIPWLEPSTEAQVAHIDLVLGLAKEHRLPAHFVLDDTDDPTSRTAEYVALRTLALGLQGQVCGTQLNALAYYDDAHAERVIRLIKQAGITVFSNPHVALVTTPLRRQPAPRGLTRVRELIEAGVPVATAQDDIDNPYYPFGRNDPLEVALFMAHLAPFAWGPEVNTVLDMLTHIPAKALGLQHYGLEAGHRANLVVLDAPNWHQALQHQAEKTWVVIGGRVAAQNARQHQLHL